MKHHYTFHLPSWLASEFRASNPTVTCDELLEKAVATYEPIKDLPHPWERPNVRLEPFPVALSEATLKKLQRLAGKMGLRLPETVMLVMATYVAWRTLPGDVVDATSARAEALPAKTGSTSEPEPAATGVILHVSVNAYTPNSDAAKLIADLVDAMSRWQIADGGNPLEIDDVLPVASACEGVPHA
jgi:hypothetical protein